MRAPTMALIGVATLAMAGLAQAQARGPQFPPPPPSALKQAVVSIGTVDVMPDVVYSTPPGFRPLKLDLYKPHQASAPLPLVIWMHGGGWQAGDPRSGPFAGIDGPTTFAELAGHGYVVASISYRFVAEATFPAQAQDMRAAIRFLRGRAAAYGIDASKVFLSGGSAGAYLAVLGGATCGETKLDPAPVQAPAARGTPPPPPAAGSECVQGVVAFYPPVDLKALAAQPGENTVLLDGLVMRLLGCQAKACSADQVALASVLGHLDAKDPPYLLIHGDADTLVSIEQSRTLEAALKTKGVPVELMVVPGANHGLPGIDVGKRTEIMNRFYAFLDKKSGK